MTNHETWRKYVKNIEFLKLFRKRSECLSTPVYALNLAKRVSCMFEWQVIFVDTIFSTFLMNNNKIGKCNPRSSSGHQQCLNQNGNRIAQSEDDFLELAGSAGNQLILRIYCWNFSRDSKNVNNRSFSSYLLDPRTLLTVENNDEKYSRCAITNRESSLVLERFQRVIDGLKWIVSVFLEIIEHISWI